MKIAFQGILGAYSHQAASEIFPTAEVIPCPSFASAIEELTQKKADYAVLPIENSTYGRVADVHELLPDSGVHIIGEHFLRVRVNWLMRPNQNPATIRRVVSHPVLLGQCRKFTAKKALETEDWNDTASAALHIAESDDPEISALSSPIAGELYGLTAIETDVEDLKNNTTRFLVLSREAKWAEPPLQNENYMTSFIFRVRNIPAALYKTLGGFATNGVNMTKLESYMVDGQFSATQFYADVEGHPQSAELAQAFQELEFFTDKFEILGVYPAHELRKTF